MWTVIINRITCRAAWKKWNAFLDKNAIRYTAHHTVTLDESNAAIAKAYAGGQRNFLFVGGDGTLHHGINTLLKLAGDRSCDITFGLLPCGTGNDWVRSFGVPRKRMAQSILEMHTTPLNVIRVTWPDGRMEYGINMVGGALDAAVVHLLKRTSLKVPSFILYPYGLMKALLRAHTWHGKIVVDGDAIQDEWLTIQAGFGKYCGGGMYVLPHARADSPGVLLMRKKPLLRILLSTPKIYSGKIIHDKWSRTYHFNTIDIMHDDKPIPIEADGEFMGYSPVKLEAVFGVMRRLV
jgi:diacylglycerol kinase (ATP)